MTFTSRMEMWLGSTHFLAALEWMASVSQWESLDVLPRHMDSALTNLTTTPLGLDKIAPPMWILSLGETCVLWANLES